MLGLVVWLTSLGVFKNPHVLAAALGIGTLAIVGSGWFVTLRTRFRVAGQVLTFLGCVVAPLNLWFYHAQNLVTVDGHLWVGGVVCCVLYAATVVILRDAVFMYAFEAGVTLTTLLLLGDLGKITDITWLSLFFMALGLISIHCERMLSPAEDSEFPAPAIRAASLLVWARPNCGFAVAPVRIAVARLDGGPRTRVVRIHVGWRSVNDELFVGYRRVAGRHVRLCVLRCCGVQNRSLPGLGRRLPRDGSNHPASGLRSSSGVDSGGHGDDFWC